MPGGPHKRKTKQETHPKVAACIEQRQPDGKAGIEWSKWKPTNSVKGPFLKYAL